jgi:hypothetical protein
VWGLPRQVAIDFSFSSDARRAFLHRKDYTGTYRDRTFALVKLGGAPVFCYFALVMNFEAHLTSFSLFIGLIAIFIQIPNFIPKNGSSDIFVQSQLFRF